MKFLALVLLILSGSFCFGNETIEQLKAKLKKTKDTEVELKINLFNDLAWEYAYQDLDTASFFASQGLQLAEENRATYPGPLANSYGTVGIIFDLKGNNNKALSYYLESLKLKTSLKDSSGIANMKTNIGALFFTQEDYSKALPYFNEALEIEVALADSMSQIGSLINIGVIQKNQGNLEISKKYLRKALTIADVYQDHYYYGIIYNNLGANFLQGNELDSAIYYFKKGETENLLSDNYYNYGISLDNQAKIHLKMSEYSIAKAKALIALKVGEENGYYFLLTNSNETLYEINLASGNIDSAFYYKERYSIYKDSILNKENKQIVDEIEAKYELEKNQKEIYMQNIELSKNEREATIFKIVLGAASLATLLLVWIVVSKIRNNKVLSDKNNVIEDALKEKEILMKEIHHRVKNNIQAIKSIINIQRRKSNSEETKDSLNETLNRVNAMALIHGKLYQQNSLYEISSDAYFKELIEDVFQSFGFQQGNSEVIIDLCHQVFETDELLTLGLVLNELVTNSCKYGKSSDGKLKLEVVSRTSNDRFVLKITDKGETQLDSKNGFGSDLIDAMIFKLKGKITYLSDVGFMATIEIPI